MIKTSIRFLQSGVVLLAIITLIMLIRLPMLEGRAENLDLLHIYMDPFILYGYLASIAFFVALYKAVKLLGYIGQNRLFSLTSLRTLKSIKHCTIIVSIAIALAAIYVRIFHHKDDDPAGFLAMCIVTSFASISVAVAITVLERISQNGIDMKSENELTI